MRVGGALLSVPAWKTWCGHAKVKWIKLAMVRCISSLVLLLIFICCLVQGAGAGKVRKCPSLEDMERSRLERERTAKAEADRLEKLRAKRAQVINTYAATFPLSTFATRRFQNLIFQAETAAKESAENNSEEEDELTCIGWFQTGGCDPDGPRETLRDQGCNAEIDPTVNSGYCQCSGGVITARASCDKTQTARYTCEIQCTQLPEIRRQAAQKKKDLLEAKKREELDRIKREELNGNSAGNNRETAEEKEVRWHEVFERAEWAAKTAGDKRPYEVLAVPETASQGDIRKAYRKLSMLLHPDKNTDILDEASIAFQDLVAAYEILNNPDKRAAFDDWGGSKGFQFEWEYEQFGQKSTRGLYKNDPLITQLTENLWNRRVQGESIWLVEFYAAWCTHCQNFVNTWKEVSRILKDKEVEVGAVNCEVETRLCKDTFGIRSYPTFRVINKKYGTQQEYTDHTHMTTAQHIADWALKVANEWRWLFSRANLEVVTAATFSSQVLNSEDFWLVLFLDSVECSACKTAKTNMMRLSAGLRGQVSVGYIDCEQPENRELCRHCGLPTPPHAPQVLAFREGVKQANDQGEVLYNPNLVEPHIALQLTERIIRLSKAKASADALMVGKESGWDEGKEEEEPDIPPPEPMWNGPKGRATLNIQQGSSHNQLRLGN